MAATLTPVHASGTPGSGRAVKVAATATPGTLLHTAVAGATSFDEVEIKAYNSDTAPRELTVELGGVTGPDDQVKVMVPPKAGLVLVAIRRLNGGVAVRAFASVANVLTCHVDITRYTP